MSEGMSELVLGARVAARAPRSSCWRSRATSTPPRPPPARSTTSSSSPARPAWPRSTATRSSTPSRCGPQVVLEDGVTRSHRVAREHRPRQRRDRRRARAGAALRASSRTTAGATSPICWWRSPQHTGAQVVVTLGAMPAQVPHSRMPLVHASSANPAIAQRFGLARPRYQGITGIVGTLQAALDHLDVPRDLDAGRRALLRGRRAELEGVGRAAAQPRARHRHPHRSQRAARAGRPSGSSSSTTRSPRTPRRADTSRSSKPSTTVRPPSSCRRPTTSPPSSSATCASSTTRPVDEAAHRRRRCRCARTRTRTRGAPRGDRFAKYLVETI